MADITIGIINPAETERVNIIVPNDVPVGQLTEAIVDAMGLPLRGQDGRRLRYHLNARDQNSLEQLDNDAALDQNEVQDGGILQLTVEMTAGPIPSSFKDFLLEELGKLKVRIAVLEGASVSPNESSKVGQVEDGSALTDNTGVILKLGELEERIEALETKLVEVATMFNSISTTLQREPKSTSRWAHSYLMKPSLSTESQSLYKEPKSAFQIRKFPEQTMGLHLRAEVPIKETQVLAQVQLDRQLETFEVTEQRKLVETIAHHTGVPEEKIKLIALISGSVLVTLEMPDGAALKFMELYLKGDQVIRELGIEKVELRPLLPPPPDKPPLLPTRSSINSKPIEPEAYKQPPPSVSYLDFDITLSGSPSEYQATGVWFDGNNRFDGGHYFRMPLSLGNLKSDYLDYMGLSFRRGGRAYRLAQELGQKLFQTLFAKTTRDCFRKCQAQAEAKGYGTRIRLDLRETPELINYPWEFLWDEEDGFLALQANTPVLRYLKATKAPRPILVEPPFRMLVVTASPVDYLPLNIEKEEENLKQSLIGLIEANLLHIEWLHHTTSVKLRQALANNREFHILHYIGHGDISEHQGGYLALERESDAGTDPLNAQRLSTLLQDCRQTKLVVLNTCRGALAGTNDPFGSIAMALTRAQVPAVVAMQYQIRNQTAINFSRIFYGCLAAGWSIDTAMSEVRKALFVDYDSDFEWTIPVLYSRSPDGVIFKPIKSTQQERQ